MSGEARLEAPLLLAGGGLLASGTPERGIEELRLPGTETVLRPETGLDRSAAEGPTAIGADHTEAGPGRLLRRSGPLEEETVLLADRPGLVVARRGADAARPWRWTVEGPVLHVEGEGPLLLHLPGARLVLEVRGGAGWEVREEGGGRIGVVASPSEPPDGASEARVLVLPAGSGPDEAPTLWADTARERLRRRLGRLSEESVRISTPDPAEDAGLARGAADTGLLLGAFRRARGWPEATPAPRPTDLALLLGAAADALHAGFHREAEGVLAAVGALLGQHDPPAPPAAAAAPLLRLAGEWLRWTGRGGPVAEIEAVLRECPRGLLAGGALARGGLAVTPAAPADEDDAADAAADLRLLAAGVEGMGRGEWADELRDAAEEVAVGGGAAATQGGEGTGGGEATAATTATGSTPAAPGRPEVGPALVGEIRRRLGRLLGPVPDAAFGRLRLAPAFPAAWDRADVEGLRVADATVRLRYRRGPEARTFTIRQESGRVPLNAVFEPLLPEGTAGAVSVGGRPAEVGREAEGGGVRIRLQFPLDPEREVSVHEPE